MVRLTDAICRITKLIKGVVHVSERKKMSLIGKITIGFIIGIVLGFIIGPIAPKYTLISAYILPILDLIGRIFIALLKMLIVPLVFTSIIMGQLLSAIPKRWGALALKLLFYT